MNLYKRCTARLYSFLVINTTSGAANCLCFRRNLLERIQKLFTAIDDKIRDEKLRHNINRETAKISALSSGEIDKCKYLTGKKILLPDQRIIELS